MRLVAGAKERLGAAEGALESMRAEHEQKVVIPRRLDEQARARVEEIQGRVDELEGEIRQTLARIEEAAAHGNYAQRADAEIEVEWTGRRLEVVRRRAEGAKLLHALVQAHEKERSSALARPLKTLVDRWLQLLSDDGYEGLRIDHDLKPTGVRVRRYGLDLPLASLRHGAQEQVVVLLRLGIASLVSGTQRNLVVIDDRLVNADALRMKRLCLILAEVETTCQVVIATCNDAPYAGLGANIMRVPGDGVLVGPPRADVAAFRQPQAAVWFTEAPRELLSHNADPVPNVLAHITGPGRRFAPPSRPPATAPTASSMISPGHAVASVPPSDATRAVSGTSNPRTASAAAR
ncbi:hypothetical protein BH23DEI1_BH23DEI1_17880 [soil metagenome]